MLLEQRLTDRSDGEFEELIDPKMLVCIQRTASYVTSQKYVRLYCLRYDIYLISLLSMRSSASSSTRRCTLLPANPIKKCTPTSLGYIDVSVHFCWVCQQLFDSGEFLHPAFESSLDHYGLYLFKLLLSPAAATKLIEYPWTLH